MNTDEILRKRLESALFKKIVTSLNDNYQSLVDEIRTISTIPSPSYNEETKAQYIEKRFRDLGLSEVKTDKMKSVSGVIKGDSSKNLMICAHIDTVFDMDTELTIKEEDDKIFCPSIGDNSTSVAGMLFLIKAFKECGYNPPCNIIFVANSCEEGLGDLKGIKYILDPINIDAMVSIDGTMGNIVNKAVGSLRFKVSIKSEGGHSWSDFGNSSAIHTLGRIISKISELKVSENPKTSFNIGKISGGTSVNTIAESADMLVDMRSVDSESLENLEKEVRKIIEDCTNESSSEYDIEIVGKRPAGNIPDDHIMTETALKAALNYGIEASLNASSTDSNIPLSRNIPAVTIGIYEGGGAHTLNEYIYPDTLQRGMPFLALFTMLYMDIFTLTR